MIILNVVIGFENLSEKNISTRSRNKVPEQLFELKSIVVKKVAHYICHPLADLRNERFINRTFLSHLRKQK